MDNLNWKVQNALPTWVKKVSVASQHKDQAHPPPFDFNIVICGEAANDNIKIFTRLT